MSDQINVPGLLEAQQQASAQVTPATGKTTLSIHDGLVILHFERGLEYAVYNPVGALCDGTRMMALAVEADPLQAQFALNLAMGVIDRVYEVRGDLKPADGAVKHELVERHRRTLTQRFAVMLNSLREKKTHSNRSLARELVDACMHEVFG